MKTFNVLTRLRTFEDRFDYVKLSGRVGEETFGFDRYLNQRFYTSSIWKSVRNEVIVRDNGCDLGIAGREIYGTIIVHHLNPITIDDIQNLNPRLLDPRYLICVSHNTHEAIHYGDKSLLTLDPIERRPGDTQLWKPIRKDAIR